jgi:hypothetical protein
MTAQSQPPEPPRPLPASLVEPASINRKRAATDCAVGVRLSNMYSHPHRAGLHTRCNVGDARAGAGATGALSYGRDDCC